jgi:hypothetical protein
MKSRTIRTILSTATVVVALVVAGCTSAGGDSTTSLGTVDGSDAGLDSAVMDLQQSILTLEKEAQAATLTEDMQTAWTSLTTELNGAMQSITALDFAGIDADALRSESAAFANNVAEAGDELSEEFRDAWDSVQMNLETVLNSVTG